MDIKDRIKLIMERENMNASTFAESINMSQASVSHNIGERNKFPSTDFIMHLSNRYQNINLNWLITGVGSMYNDGTEDSLNSQNPENAGIGTSDSENRKDFEVETPKNTTQSADIQNIVYVEKAPRKITEIRVFFDDNTYEIFKPEK